MYRSDRSATPPPDIDVQPIVPPESVPRAAAPAQAAASPRFVRAMDVVSMPFQIMLLMGLTPLRWLSASPPRRDA